MSLSCIHTRAGCSITDASGSIRPCCKYGELPGLPTIFTESNLNDYLGSKAYKRLRSQLDSGSFPSGCSSCSRMESAGLQSRRQYTAEFYSGTRVDRGLVDLEIGLDYTCNMMCRSCGAGASSRWGAAGSVLDQFDAEGIPRQPSVAYRSYADRFREVAAATDFSAVRHCKIEGGEPFYSRNLAPFLKRLAATARRPDGLALNIFTNASVFPDADVLDLLRRFNTSITFSLDAVGDLAEVIRWGVPWQVVADNVARWVEFAEFNTIVCTTVSIQNCNQLAPLIEFCAGLNLEMDFSELMHPNYLSMYGLPMATRQGWCQGVPVLDRLLTADISVEPEFERLRRSIQILDQYQGVSFAAANPEMARLIGL